MGTLTREQRMAGIAAIALAVSLILPWYSKNALVNGRFADTGLSAFGVFSFVEAAILLVAAGVLYLLHARSQERGFHLPGGDGAVVFAAGVWATLLLIWRLFDKPDVDDPGATVGISWGFFFALAAAGLLAAAGERLRQAHVPEPPNPAEGEAPRRSRRERRRPVDPTSVTEVLRDRPSWQGEPPEPPRRARKVSEGGRARPEAGAAPEPAKPPEPAPPDRLF